MKLLDAVNLVLPKLGEHPVTSLEVRHPTLAIILPEVENELRTTLLRGWWFNQFKYEAMPALDGTITLGANTLSFVPNVDQKFAAVRGDQLYNQETASFIWDAKVVGLITEYVDFELLPESAAQYVFYSALLTTYITDIGMSQEVQAWSSKASEAYQQLLAEHLRQRRYSTRGSGRFQRLRRAMRA